MDRALVIFNPYAGRGRAQRRIPAVRQALEAAGVAFELAITQERGHAIELADRAARAGGRLIVAAGGDGTVNEVVNGLAQAAGTGALATLGVLPVGSANDFAEMTGVALDLTEAARRLKRGRVRAVDLGCVNGRFFANNVGAGFEARASIESHRLTWLQGTPLYVVAVLRALVSYSLPVVDIEWDEGRLHQKRVLMVSACNTRRTGGGFYITPDAEPDDGLLDLCIADALPPWQILRLLPKVLRGAHRHEPAIYLTRTRRLRLQSDDPLPVHADGEVLWQDANRLDIAVEPGRLPVVV